MYRIVDLKHITATHVLGVGQNCDAGAVRRYWRFGCDNSEVARVCKVGAEAFGTVCFMFSCVHMLVEPRFHRHAVGQSSEA
jgi:hypothetical protein